MSDESTFHLILPAGEADRFHPLLQQGVGMEVRVGGSLQRFLEEDLGLDPAYIKGRITTVFLDGRPIDDFNIAQVRDGSTVALSGAMPGLVGATLRRGGHLAAMRGSITYRDAGEGEEGWGRVRVKLFNLLLSELGPVLLGRGIRIRAAELKGIVGDRADLAAVEGEKMILSSIIFREG